MDPLIFCQFARVSDEFNQIFCQGSGQNLLEDSARQRFRSAMPIFQPTAHESWDRLACAAIYLQDLIRSQIRDLLATMIF